MTIFDNINIINIIKQIVLRIKEKMKKICLIVFVTFLFFLINLKNVKAEQYENIDIVTVANHYIDEYFDCSYHLKNYEYIYDLDNNSYYLIHVDPIGYMIIDKDTFNLQEASVSMNSHIVNMIVVI